MNTEYLLVKWSDNYADEFDINSLWICNKSEYDEFVKVLSNCDNEIREIYFGTNEAIRTSPKEILNNIAVSSISEEFYNTFFRLIGPTSGLIDLDFLIEIFNEE